jgi:hypothetical protein
MTDEPTKEFERLYARDGARIVASAVNPKQIAEYFFRQGVGVGHDAALSRAIDPKRNDSILSETAARAF